MKPELEQQNRRLLRDVNDLIQVLSSATIPIELDLYRQRIIEACEDVKETIQENLLLLPYIERVTKIRANVISNTQRAIQRLRQLSAISAPPILRAADIDKLSLVIVNWLHQVHPQTMGYGAAVSNHSWSVSPFHKLPIYYIPYPEQSRLLHLALFFHEFGHVLYYRHEPEMEELVKEMQRKILTLLTPPRRRNDVYDKKRTAQRQVIAYVWYTWIQELFCDAVGFTIGGPCFLKAFSSYLATFNPSDFHQGADVLAVSTHPVPWLRVQFLSKMARKAGFAKLADEVERQWRGTAQALQIQEDYYGFYDAGLENTIVATIEDMLIEAAPRKFQDTDLNLATVNADFSPVSVLNQAWQKYDSDAENYTKSESVLIGKILSSVAKTETLH